MNGLRKHYMENLIELDKYLDLSKLDLVNKEFIDSIHKIPKEYIEDFSGGYIPNNKSHLGYKNTEQEGETRIVILRDVISEYYKIFNYSMIDKSDYWMDDLTYDYFPLLKEFVSNLPFKNIGRLFFIFNENTTDPIFHVDHGKKEWRQEMIWISLSNSRKLFVMENNKPIYMKGYSCWFDSTKVHGCKTNGHGVSIRIDGEFTSDFRRKLFGKNSKWKTIPIMDKYEE